MKKLIQLVFLMALGNFAHAQVWSAGGHFNGGIALGEFKQETGGLFIPTISGILLYEAPTAPVSLGLELGYGIYGSKMERRTDLYRGFSDELRLRRNNNIATGMAVIRYQTNPLGNIRHFIEAKFGANYLYTRYKVRETILSEEIIESGKDFENWTLAYSLGTGVQIPIAAEPGLFLEFKANYQSSSDLRFLTKGDVRYVPFPDGGGEFEFETKRAPLDQVVLSFGVIFIGL
ncbi:hypothetical protein [Algoriphagus confluentis]|uniref:Outer membrane protein beta-barrel domain-containing protein n=1 Tax=Algoriphagus confluentis TaxID=1697556 RepID=A0ABQ6PLA6_9BACT|nr:hypothetical protein Aconfl_09600 [Algoriphagus confluentis]